MEIPPSILAKLERLAAFEIELVPVPGMGRHVVFARNGYASLVERRTDGFGQIGAAGLVTGGGFAALVWREERPWFVGRGFEQAASEEQVASLRRFAADLHVALES